MFSHEFLSRKITSFPKWPCPICSSGRLIISGEPQRLESKRSIDSRDNTGEMDIFEASFFASFQCDNPRCGIWSIVSGESQLESIGFDIYDKNYEFWYSYSIKSVVPPLRFIEVPLSTPSIISDEIDTCFSLYWISIDACANSIRKVTEKVLTNLGYHQLKRENLGNRLTRFFDDNPHPVSKEIMDAIRLTGNSGSHEDNKFLDDSDIESLFFLLESTLRLYYGERLESDIAMKLKAKHKPE